MNNGLISKQSAIDEIECELEMINSALDSITLDFNARERLRQRRGEAREILNSIQQLPSAQPEPHWIPCGEKMPENEATVLVTVGIPSGAPKVFEMSYSNGYWYRNDMLISPWWVVVAWRPMPKPYFEGVLCGWAFEKEWEEQNGSKVQ